jgi:hypothetical protein
VPILLLKYHNRVLSGGEMMKTFNKGAIRDEKGQVLIMALVLLVVGGLILAPLLGLMSTGLLAGQVYEKKMHEYYAADAGVEDALWQLKQLDPDPIKVPSTPEQAPLTYLLGSAVNNKTIEVTIDMISGIQGGGIYKVTSTANSADSSTTTIESLVQTLPLFWNNAITSTSDVTLQPNSQVYGDVMGNLTGPGDVPAGEVYGNVSGPYDPDKWPFSGNFRDFYWPQAENATLPYDPGGCSGNDTLDVAVNSTFGPGFHDGNLYIKSGSKNVTATLTGTVYIKGDDARLYIGAGTGSKEFYLDLNYQTIYVEGRNHDLSQPNKNALYVDKSVHLIGSGAIIAEGNIDFHPTMDLATEDDFIFVMSLFGKVQFFPNGVVYGSLAGRDVYLGPDNVITHTDAPSELNFPMDAVECSVKILTWDIS